MSSQPYGALVEQHPDVLLVVVDGVVTYGNAAARRMFAGDPAGLALDALLPAGSRRAASARLARVLGGEAVPPVEQVFHTLGGGRIELETAAHLADLHGERLLVIAGRDLSGRRLADEAVWAAERRFAAAFHAAPIPMLLIDPRGVVLDANRAVGDLVARDPRRLVGRQSLRLVHRDDRATVREILRMLATRERTTVTAEWRLIRADADAERRGPEDEIADQILVHGSCTLLPGEPVTFSVQLVDVTEQRAAEAELAHRALHDPLTGLPNRALLLDRLAHAVATTARQADAGLGTAVLYLDLDGFKAINDTHGHAAGDRVLIEVARRLVTALRPADTVARLGGDEYAVVAESLPLSAAHELVGRLEAAIAAPVDGLSVRASIGLAHTSQVTPDPDVLLRAADEAMYRAKARARRRHS